MTPQDTRDTHYRESCDLLDAIWSRVDGAQYDYDGVRQKRLWMALKAIQRRELEHDKTQERAA